MKGSIEILHVLKPGAGGEHGSHFLGGDESDDRQRDAQSMIIDVAAAAVCVILGTPNCPPPEILLDVESVGDSMLRSNLHVVVGATNKFARAEQFVYDGQDGDPSQEEDDDDPSEGDSDDGFTKLRATQVEDENDTIMVQQAVVGTFLNIDWSKLVGKFIKTTIETSMRRESQKVKNIVRSLEVKIDANQGQIDKNFGDLQSQLDASKVKNGHFSNLSFCISSTTSIRVSPSEPSTPIAAVSYAIPAGSIVSVGHVVAQVDSDGSVVLVGKLPLTHGGLRLVLDNREYGHDMPKHKISEDVANILGKVSVDHDCVHNDVIVTGSFTTFCCTPLSDKYETDVNAMWKLWSQVKLVLIGGHLTGPNLEAHVGWWCRLEALRSIRNRNKQITKLTKHLVAACLALSFQACYSNGSLLCIPKSCRLARSP